MGKYVTFGEIMLRLKSPGHERYFQSPEFEATFGGGESNVAVALEISLVARRLQSQHDFPKRDVLTH